MKRFSFILSLILATSAITVAQETIVCPKISVNGQLEGKPRIEKPRFEVVLSGEAEKYNLKFSWSSTAPILSGQGTRSIVVIPNPDGMEAATVEIEGLPKGCPNTASDSMPTICLTPAEKFDEYESVGAEEERKRINRLIDKLQYDREDRSAILLSNTFRLQEHLKFLNDYLTLKRQDKARYTYYISNEKSETTELWVIPNGAEFSFCENCLIIKAEDFEKLQNIFAPKPKTKRKNK